MDVDERHREIERGKRDRVPEEDRTGMKEKKNHY